VSLSELSKSLGVVKSNVHRLLQSLIELRYVSRNEDGTYRPCIRLLSLATSVTARFDLRLVALPFMQWLLEQTRETVHLSVLDGEEVFYVEKLESPEPVRAYSEVGGRAPAHCVATGKAMLAFRSEREIALLASHLKAHSPKTITRPDKFIAELKSVAANGYAVNRGEWRESVRGVAAPIVDSSGQVIAAIGISGPAERIKAARYAEFGAHVIKAAAAISSALRGEASDHKLSMMLAGMKRTEPPAGRAGGRVVKMR
jgi:DNA-binding IclR family transcriptional regulator